MKKRVVTKKKKNTLIENKLIFKIMKLQTAARKRAKIKMALQGPSGSGKSFSALQIAKGLCLKWGSVAVIYTENASSELYSLLGSYRRLPHN